MPTDIPQTWHDLDSARTDWRDAPANDMQLQTLLDVAQTQVEAYGPLTLEEADPVPTNYRLAQLMQTRNLWNANKVDAGSGQIGDDTFAIRPFPMDWVVKNVIRPKRGVPVVG